MNIRDSLASTTPLDQQSGAALAAASDALAGVIARAIRAAGGWLGFDRFMELALYAPGLGYYAGDARQFGVLPSDGSDFVTAPELSPLFGHALAAQLGQALEATGTDTIYEFGAGSGALAAQLLDALGGRVAHYCIVDLSAALRERQQATLARHAPKVRWLDTLPDRMHGVVVGNELLDAMPVRLLARSGGGWRERGVALQADGRIVFADRPTGLRPPLPVDGAHDYLTELHEQAEDFVRTLAQKLERGAAFFIDYGFPQAEYYHPQRHMGTVMCHRAHRSDSDPLADIGAKDITAHVDFTGTALAAQDAGLHVLGYTSQARFLINCGLLSLVEHTSQIQRARMNHLLLEHEMGELFKVIGFAAGRPFDALGFAAGDRSHRL